MHYINTIFDLKTHIHFHPKYQGNLIPITDSQGSPERALLRFPVLLVFRGGRVDAVADALTSVLPRWAPPVIPVTQIALKVG